MKIYFKDTRTYPNFHLRVYLESKEKERPRLLSPVKIKDRFQLSRQVDKEWTHYDYWLVGWKNAQKSSYRTKFFLDALLSFLTYNKLNLEVISNYRIKKYKEPIFDFSLEKSEFQEIIDDISKKDNPRVNMETTNPEKTYYRY